MLNIPKVEYCECHCIITQVWDRDGRERSGGLSIWTAPSLLSTMGGPWTTVSYRSFVLILFHHTSNLHDHTHSDHARADHQQLFNWSARINITADQDPHVQMAMQNVVWLAIWPIKPPGLYCALERQFSTSGHIYKKCTLLKPERLTMVVRICYCCVL